MFCDITVVRAAGVCDVIKYNGYQKCHWLSGVSYQASVDSNCNLVMCCLLY